MSQTNSKTNPTNTPVRVIQATEVSEGAGFTVHRTIGTPALRNLDPFLMLDYFNNDDPTAYMAGFPEHPHRGFNTFTYMLDGAMEHKDSMGNTGRLTSGSAQWMKAASGIIHSEMPQQENGLMRGFQLWINLPAAHKMDEPAYQEFSADAFPVIDADTHTTKVIIGTLGDVTAPIQDEHTQVSYIDVAVQPKQGFTHILPAGHRGFLYTFEGDGHVNGQSVPPHAFVLLDEHSSDIEFVAGEQGGRFILVTGQPIGEPIVQRGPFVMNTREEIEQAMRDYQSNQLVRKRAQMQREPVTA